MIRMTTTLGLCGLLAACSTGGGTYDGVPINPTDTQSCVTPQGEITAPNSSDREIQLRCAPQTQPLTGS